MEVLQRTANRGSISTGYEIDNSCKFEIDNSECLTKTFGSSGNRKAWTWSSWVKRTELNSTTTYQLLFSAGTGNPPRDVFFFDDDTDDTLCFFSNGGLLSSATLGFRTNAVFRDTSAWYHIVLVLDTANSTAADRLKLYVNGVSQTFSTYNAPTQNADSLINSNTAHAIARDSSFEALGFNAQYFSGYMAETHFVDGSALAPTSFGEVDDDSGIWKPKAYTGSYGTNGFYLDYADAADLGDDESGNGNDWTEVNITAADQATDTPTNNFCTLNVIANIENNAVVFTEGATVGSVSGGGNVSDHAMATMGFSSGKWYYEAYVTTGSTNDDAMFGFANTNGWYQGLGNYTFSAGAHNVGRWYYNSNTFTTTGATAWDKGDIVQIAIDCDNGKCWSGVNGTYSSGDPSTNTGGFDWDANVTNMSIGDLVIPVTRVLYTAPGTTYYNFGGYTLIPISSAASDANGYGTFEYAPPTGFYAICGKNLAEYGGTA